jgi:hypothetical protein
MARLDELSKYKVTIMSRIIEDQDLCKAIYYTDNDFLSKPNIDPYSLLYENIFPYRIIPEEVQDVSKTYVNLSFQRFRSVNNAFKSGYIYVYILCHVGALRTSYGKIRYDYIANKIDNMLNQERGIGLGKLEFHEMNELIINNKYIGLSLCYESVDFG